MKTFFNNLGISLLSSLLCFAGLGMLYLIISVISSVTGFSILISFLIFCQVTTIFFVISYFFNLGEKL